MRLWLWLGVLGLVGCGEYKGQAAQNDTAALVDDTAGGGILDADDDGYPASDDCDDADASIHPDAAEGCDGVDQDCDGQIDNDPVDGLSFFLDADGDGYGAGEGVTACAPEAGLVAEAGDCDDRNVLISPIAVEECDGVDQDCDGLVDDDAIDGSAWFEDLDGDGFGDPDSAVIACEGDGLSRTGGDCDDDDASVSPRALEVCDEIDNDCDGEVDDTPSDAATFYADTDDDGFGDIDAPLIACFAPGGYTTDATDCDDTWADIFPGAAETCDGRDEDCDGAIDDGLDTDGLWYPDNDGDGYGDRDGGETTCAPPEGWVRDGTDCDDADAGIWIGCRGSGLTGETGDVWETMAGTSGSYLWGIQIYQPADWRAVYSASSPTQMYTPSTNTWTSRSSTAVGVGAWSQPAPVDGRLYLVRGGGVQEYTPETDTWRTVYTIPDYSSDDATVSDSDFDGNVYGHYINTSGQGVILRYNARTATPTRFLTGMTSLYETRLAYDPTTNAIFFGAFYYANLHRLDLATGAVTRMADIPESMLNDIFCGDRSGHIYAAGDSSGTTIFQYDIATNTWARIPNTPVDHGNNGACMVAEEGWLYVGVMESGSWIRLALY